MSAPVARDRRLTAGYDSAAVIRDVSLEVAAGEVVALLGANGAGKAGDTPRLRPRAPDERRDPRRGQDLQRVSASARARLGIAHVPESRGLFFGLTVAEHLRLGYRREQLDAEAAHRTSLHWPPEGPALRPPLRRRAADAGRRQGFSPGSSCSSTSSASAWPR